MVEIIENFIDMSTSFINSIFMLQLEVEKGSYVPVGKIVVAFLFTVFALYFILDAMGILDRGGEE